MVMHAGAEKLVRTAIRAYARSGIHGVSLREIVRRSGMKNEAAVRYHFGSKRNLLSACVASVADAMKPIESAAIETLQMLHRERRITVRDVMIAEFTPMSTYFEQSAFGIDSICFLARMIREEGPAGQDMLLSAFMSGILVAEHYLAELLPEKSPRAIRFHNFLAMNSMLNGLADQGLLERLPSPSDPAKGLLLDKDEQTAGFIDYVTAGVSTASAIG